MDEPVELSAARLIGNAPELVLEDIRIVPCPQGGTEDCDLGIVGEEWPLEFESEPVEGYALRPDGRSHDIVAVVRVPDSSGRYTVEGVRLEYRAGPRRFVTEVGPRITIRAR